MSHMGINSVNKNLPPQKHIYIPMFVAALLTNSQFMETI